MTDNAKELDIAQRIVEAMKRTSEPRPTADGQFKPDEDTVIGEVPEHLRHLHNLLDELGNEARAAEQHFREAKNRHEALHAIFFDALKHHVPCDGNGFNGIKLCEGWQVVGYKRDKRPGSFEEMLRQAMVADWRSVSTSSTSQGLPFGVVLSYCLVSIVSICIFDLIYSRSL